MPLLETRIVMCVVGGFVRLRLLCESCVQVLENVLELPRVHPDGLLLLAIFPEKEKGGGRALLVVHLSTAERGRERRTRSVIEWFEASEGQGGRGKRTCT